MSNSRSIEDIAGDAIIGAVKGGCVGGFGALVSLNFGAILPCIVIGSVGGGIFGAISGQDKVDEACSNHDYDKDIQHSNDWRKIDFKNKFEQTQRNQMRGIY